MYIETKQTRLCLHCHCPITLYQIHKYALIRSAILMKAESARGLLKRMEGLPDAAAPPVASSYQPIRPNASRQLDPFRNSCCFVFSSSKAIMMNTIAIIPAFNQAECNCVPSMRIPNETPAIFF